jgi:hypothetical protein
MTKRWKTVRLVADLRYDAALMHGDEPDEIRWFNEEILLDKDGMTLHSHEIGDSIGILTVREILPLGRKPKGAK